MGEAKCNEMFSSSRLLKMQFVPSTLQIVSIIGGLLTQEGFIAYNHAESLRLFEGE
jgi:hypothetical protein